MALIKVCLSGQEPFYRDCGMSGVISDRGQQDPTPRGGAGCIVPALGNCTSLEGNSQRARGALTPAACGRPCASNARH